MILFALPTVMEFQMSIFFSLIALHKREDREATLTAVQPPGRYGALQLMGDAVKQFQENLMEIMHGSMAAFLCFSRAFWIGLLEIEPVLKPICCRSLRLMIS